MPELPVLHEFGIPRRHVVGVRWGQRRPSRREITKGWAVREEGQHVSPNLSKWPPSSWRRLTKLQVSTKLNIQFFRPNLHMFSFKILTCLFYSKVSSGTISCSFVIIFSISNSCSIVHPFPYPVWSFWVPQTSMVLSPTELRLFL